MLLLLAAGMLPHAAAASGTTVDSHEANTVTRGTGSIPSDVVESNITNVTASADAFASVNGTPYFWQSADHRFDVTVSTNTSGAYALCLSPDSGTNRTATTCEQFSATATENQSNTTVVTFAPNRTRLANTTRMTIALKNATTNSTLDTASVGIAAKSGDLDGDGLSNERELEVGTDVGTADTDDDGLADGPEVDQYETDPTVADTDGDGLRDGAEVHEHGTDPKAVDTDSDGLADDVEVQSVTSPTDPDTDDDGLTDSAEVEGGTDPTAVDTDDDGLTDLAERKAGTDPTRADTDGDGLTDAKELDGPTSPTDPDSDDDGLQDGRELAIGTDPTAADSDGDGLNDHEEVTDLGTDPTEADTDGDFLSDKTEAKLGTDPTDSLSPAWITGGMLGFLVGVGATVVVTRREWGGSLRPDFVSLTPSYLRRVVTSEARDASVTAVEAVSGSDATPNTAESGEMTAAEVVECAEVELVSDAELVQRMLRAEGGRMRQSEIVDATGWSKAKVSRRLSAMADDGDVTKVEIGRENLICLDGAVPELATPREVPSSSKTGRLAATASGQ
ncbi:helix-turn-helix transcriptional regulator [Halorussus salinisoli]|uniref:helix-turn-helix transcriptional regulator n=1 Tax=Halorussus salinisoli TaxID=2558242 RepID=UPI002A917E75|nr:hypothetical protein [Halorussus salinisoli]